MYSDFDMFDEIRSGVLKTAEYLKEITEINRRNNVLLMRCIQQSVAYCDLPERIDDISGNGLIIVAPREENAIDLIKEMISNKGHNIRLISKDYPVHSVSEIAAAINSLKDGDYLFLNYDNCFSFDGIDELIIDAVKFRIIRVNIGRGTSKKRIDLDVPSIKFIIYTSIPQLLSTGLKQAINYQLGFND